MRRVQNVLFELCGNPCGRTRKPIGKLYHRYGRGRRKRGVPGRLRHADGRRRVDRARLEIHRLYHLDQLHERIRNRERCGPMAGLRGKRRRSQRRSRRLRNTVAKLQRHPLPIPQSRSVFVSFERELRIGTVSQRARRHRFVGCSRYFVQYWKLLPRMVCRVNQRYVQGIVTKIVLIRGERYL